MRTTFVSSGYEGAHIQETSGVDVDQREVPNHDIDTFYQQYRQISRCLVEPTTEPTTTEPPPYLVYKITSLHSANTNLLNEIILNRLYAWKRVADKMSRETIIDYVERLGLSSTAERLSYLNKLIEEDPEEVPMGVESLRQFGDFVMKKHLPEPKIGLNPDGSVHAVWWADDHDGILAMDFLPSGEIRYAAVLQDHGWSVSGVSPPDRMMEEIKPFKRVLD